MKYTPEQQKAIETVDKNLAVTAGAGAGKTRVLVDRILYILRQGFADIDEIVAITYTNKAALEIRERLRKELQKQKDEDVLAKNLRKLGTAYIGTIHSFCLRLLEENPVEAGIDPVAKILEEYRADAWLKESLKEAVLEQLDNKHVYQLTLELGFNKLLREICGTMKTMQNQGVDVEIVKSMAATDEEQAIAHLICLAFEKYQNKKEEQLFLDYEDILQKTLRMLNDHHEILQDYRKKFKFIMVDEYQDLNFVQDRILRLLGEGTNLFVVGDKKQSIYGFRGARVELFEKLKADLESLGQAIVLKDNFRSDRRIIEFVNQSFKNLMAGYEPISANRANKACKNICFITPKSSGNMAERRKLEAEFIARKILQMMADDEVYIPDRESQEFRKPKFRDFAVLLRKRTHLKHYISAFNKYNIPFHVADSGSLMESSGVKKLLFALNAIEIRDNVNLYGTLAHLFNVGDDSIAEYVLKCGQLYSGLKKDADFTGVSEKLVKAFQMIRGWCKIKSKVTLRELAGEILNDTGLEEELAKTDPLELESLYKFLDLCWQYDLQGYTLKEFLEELADFGDEQQEATEVSEEEDVVKFITIHSSKGLEFPIVFLADSGQNISNSASSEILFDPERGLALKKDKDKWEKLKGHLEQREIEEAKRLLYVALTRARDYLVISGELASDKKESFLKWLLQEKALSDEITVEEKVLEPAVSQREELKLQDIKPKSGLFIKPSIEPCRIHVLKQFSVTSLGEFVRCPRKYYFSNVLDIPEGIFYKRDGDATRLSAAERGTIVHELIEKVHRDKSREVDVQELLSQYGYSLSSEDTYIIEECLNNFAASEIYEIKGEAFYEMPLDYCINDSWLLTGKADLLIFEDDGVTIVDFKTNAKIHQDLLEIYRLQVLTYALAISEIYGIKPKRAIIASLYEGNFIEVDTAPNVLAECRDQILSIINNIESGTFSGKALDTAACGYCAYKNLLCKLL